MTTKTLGEYGPIASGLLLVAIAAAEIVVRPRVGAGIRQELDAVVAVGALALIVVSVATLVNNYKQ